MMIPAPNMRVTGIRNRKTLPKIPINLKARLYTLFSPSNPDKKYTEENKPVKQPKINTK